MKVSVLTLAAGVLTTAAHAGLTHHYKFDTDASDASGGGNHGTLFGGSSITANSKVGAGALNLVPAGGVTVPAFALPNQLTFASWVNLQTMSRTDNQFCGEAFLFTMTTNGPGSSSPPNFQVRVNNNIGTLIVAMFDGAAYQWIESNGNNATSPPPYSSVNLLNGLPWNLNPPGWAHVAAIYDAYGNEKLYINGQKVVEGNLTVGLPGTVVWANIGKVQVGDSYWPGGYFPQGFNNGRMDEVRIYNTALTDGQINALFNPSVLGDMNGANGTNNQDIAPFVLALTNYAQYQLDYPGIDGIARGDINQDSVLNNQDIAPFVALLTAGRPLSDFSGDPDFAPLFALVPEPTALSLLMLGGLMLHRRRRTDVSS